jgi:hypothetical protein
MTDILVVSRAVEEISVVRAEVDTAGEGVEVDAVTSDVVESL